ncbi:FAD-binding oxidoreductase [Streptomyces sp. NBC_01789]|uniref:FAD-binding oxidoreductase n=1 Tax=Streptomyces sp. NBC_01789 TaxID=2975941 RepID=UPI00225339D4|nr:FAD-dependent oxidoreductase [Streptomyces sp. NBC_01789]MCX4448418.1 FAD-dependent oxidoreductase [Streptomyces sp. NBC_01789]
MKVRRLPPGVDGREFTRALAAFRVALGPRWVLTEGAVGLPGYADPQPVLDAQYFSASAALMPGSVEDVRAVVRIAGAFGVPLSPVLPGRDPGFGGPAPRLPGAVAVDLARMNRIVEVDPAGGYAVVEPGVTFHDLAARVAGLGLAQRPDPEGPRWGSVLGEVLERSTGGAGYEGAASAPYGMEIVLADGDVVRTGMAALTGAGPGPWAPYGCGPALGPMFARSALGIVTKLGVRLRPEPAARRAYAVALPREDDIGLLVDALRPLLMDRTVADTPTVRSVLLDAAAAGRRAPYDAGTGPLPDSVVRTLMADLGLGRWNLYGVLAGAPAVMDAQWSVIRDALAAVPGARFRCAGASDGDADSVRPRADEADGWLPHGGRLDLTPVSPTTGADALAQYALARDHAHAYGKDYLGAFAVGARELHHRFTAVFDTLDPDDRARALELCEALIRATAAAGYGVQRAHPALMDQVAATYGFNDHAVRRLGERIKDALDAEGILAPGKHGIWPRRYRGLGL